MHKILLPRYATYKEVHQIRGNGRATQDAPQNPSEGPHVSVHEEDTPRGGPPGVGRPQGLAEPGLNPVQVPFDVACPLLFLKHKDKVSLCNLAGTDILKL